jgi:hypothetical protein
MNSRYLCSEVAISGLARKIVRYNVLIVRSFLTVGMSAQKHLSLNHLPVGRPVTR